MTLGDLKDFVFLQLEEYYKDVRDDNAGKFQFYDLGNTYKVEFVDADLKTISIVYVNTLFVS